MHEVSTPQIVPQQRRLVTYLPKPNNTMLFWSQWGAVAIMTSQVPEHLCSSFPGLLSTLSVTSDKGQDWVSCFPPSKIAGSKAWLCWGSGYQEISLPSLPKTGIKATWSTWGLQGLLLQSSGNTGTGFLAAIHYPGFFLDINNTGFPWQVPVLKF